MADKAARQAAIAQAREQVRSGSSAFVRRAEPVDKWLPLPGDGPVTTDVIAILRRVTGTEQFVTRLIEADLLDVVAQVRELEAQADQIAGQLLEEIEAGNVDARTVPERRKWSDEEFAKGPHPWDEEIL